VKKIEAIVREDTFNLIKIALEEKGFISMTVSYVLDCNAVVDTICGRGRTGLVGGGKVFILPVENAVRIRTVEIGAAVV
jgi:nitrogen regulatory protein PII